MRSLSHPRKLPARTVPAVDRDFVESQLDELLESLFEHSSGSEERFTEMLAHFVAITVAPSLAATNMLLRLPRISTKNREQPLRLTVCGDTSFVSQLGDFENELAEAVTNAVLQTLLGPSPRISVVDAPDINEELFLN